MEKNGNKRVRQDVDQDVDPGVAIKCVVEDKGACENEQSPAIVAVCERGQSPLSVADEIEDPSAKRSSSNGDREPKRYKKRKIALMIAYCGAGFQGMQRNPGATTIEGELEKALFQAGAIQDSNVGQPKKVGWMRAARTDKGVSALGQVVSGNFFIDPPGLVERVNSHLPAPIRVLGYKRVTPSFDAKQNCVRRRYEYVLPVYVFDPDLVTACLAEQEANNPGASELDDGAIAALTSSDGAVQSDSTTVDTTAVDVSDTASEQQTRSVSAIALSDVETAPAPRIQNPEEDGNQRATRAAAKEAEKDMEMAEIRKYLMEKSGAKNAFQFGEDCINRLNRVLGRFVGSHSYHNFTPRTKATDPSSLRYIISFEAESKFVVDGVEFVRCSVVGQSFMLHQIRRMVGLAVAVVRGCAPESILETALRRDSEVKVPMAPELGLFLEECYYSSYNSKFGKLHEEVSLVDYTTDVRKFKHEVIYPHIASTEARDLVFASWVQRINDEHFPHFALAREKENLAKAAPK
ncbi:tRNA pseudouridine38-40 synthase [Marchantia polymorpha subsp. ruderalis]|uniref:Pseudouridine synthase I TruA alpha/beta domain-containing protein n=2 Tax=Marchantia polymorpha TaxID=3197 RepID=A0AAF6AT14_MARPO|nr:hypothetical protein MARPO_0001s0557 [Marchantia polymorpha]BBM99584.1 hypothetical protein Mp_1g22190 [Marchantia polymorpha subsp. ruderalis]|eukprot:PTQ50672.1 hypothetical protein MARPO_0001s0557 [Marchantia polymorpha]